MLDGAKIADAETAAQVCACTHARAILLPVLAHRACMRRVRAACAGLAGVPSRAASRRHHARLRTWALMCAMCVSYAWLGCPY